MFYALLLCAGDNEGQRRIISKSYMRLFTSLPNYIGKLVKPTKDIKFSVTMTVVRLLRIASYG